MTAKDIISHDITGSPAAVQAPQVSGDTSVYDVIPAIAESPTHTLSVRQEGAELGTIDCTSLLTALASGITMRGECSTVTLECAPGDYSASMIAHAVEDVDATPLNINVSQPADAGGEMQVSLRINRRDPEAAIRSLERYGFRVVEAYGSPEAPTALQERLAALQAYLNV